MLMVTRKGYCSRLRVAALHTLLFALKGPSPESQTPGFPTVFGLLGGITVVLGTPDD